MLVKFYTDIKQVIVTDYHFQQKKSTINHHNYFITAKFSKERVVTQKCNIHPLSKEKYKMNSTIAHIIKRMTIIWFTKWCSSKNWTNTTSWTFSRLCSGVGTTKSSNEWQSFDLPCDTHRKFELIPPLEHFPSSARDCAWLGWAWVGLGWIRQAWTELKPGKVGFGKAQPGMVLL